MHHPLPYGSWQILLIARGLALDEAVSLCPRSEPRDAERIDQTVATGLVSQRTWPTAPATCPHGHPRDELVSRQKGRLAGDSTVSSWHRTRVAATVLWFTPSVFSSIHERRESSRAAHLWLSSATFKLHPRRTTGARSTAPQLSLSPARRSKRRKTTLGFASGL
jgi:hypothetical protein